MSASPTDPFGLVGHPFAERFRVERVVGEGGFAVVYAARHLALDTAVALKVMKAHEVPRESRAAFDAMFLAEARTIAKLRHPSIVQVTDCGVATLGDGNAAPWMALEWLDGETLEGHLEARRGRGGTTPAAALALLRPAFEAVAYAHEQGVAHRDLKPANLMLVPSAAGPSLRVMDFGVAKVMSAEGEEHLASGFTRTRSTAGGFSPPYAAPEQVTGMRTGPWTDVHALALIVVELLLDRPAYDATSHQTLYGQILATERPSPARLGYDVGAWEPVLQQALAWAPDARFASARALLHALEATVAQARVVRLDGIAEVSGHGAHLGTAATQHAPQTTLRSGAVERTVSAPSRPAPRRGAALVAGTLVVLAGGAVALGLRARSTASERGSVAATATSSPPAVSGVGTGAPLASAALPSVGAPSAELPRAAPSSAETPRVASVTAAASALRAPLAAAPRGATGVVRVLVLPSGDVSIDGRPRGRAPVTATLIAGRHTIRVSGAVDATRTVDVAPGSTQTVALGRAGLE